MDDNKYLMLTARILLGLVFVYFVVGIDLSKELFSGPIATAGKKGIPALIVWIGLMIKLFGGIGIIIGYQTRLSAIGLIIFTLSTAFIFHLPNGPATFYVMFTKELCMVGGLLLLAIVGPGELSLDERKKPNG